jgi:hypothetical protein
MSKGEGGHALALAWKPESSAKHVQLHFASATTCNIGTSHMAEYTCCSSVAFENEDTLALHYIYIYIGACWSFALQVRKKYARMRKQQDRVVEYVQPCWR